GGNAGTGRPVAQVDDREDTRPRAARPGSGQHRPGPVRGAQGRRDHPGSRCAPDGRGAGGLARGGGRRGRRVARVMRSTETRKGPSLSRRFFGTDGIRGRLGEGAITPELVLKLGWAAGRVLCRNTDNPKVVIGKDTRVSGYLLESALEAGLSAAGVSVLLIGPMPTPGIAYLARTARASAGIVISASHNPFEDNEIGRASCRERVK